MWMLQKITVTFNRGLIGTMTFNRGFIGTMTFNRGLIGTVTFNRGLIGMMLNNISRDNATHHNYTDANEIRIRMKPEKQHSNTVK